MRIAQRRLWGPSPDDAGDAEDDRYVQDSNDANDTRDAQNANDANDANEPDMVNDTINNVFIAVTIVCLVVAFVMTRAFPTQWLKIKRALNIKGHARNAAARVVPLRTHAPKTLDAVAIFCALDQNQDGVVTRAEIEAYFLARRLNPQEAHELITLLDADADGVVTQDELTRAVASLKGEAGPLSALMVMRPPPARVVNGRAVDAFEGLVRTGGPISIDKAEERAITLEQLRAVFGHASVRVVSEGWLGKRPQPKDGAWAYEPLQSDSFNLYDLASHVILPATYARVRPDGGRPSYVELVASAPQRPDYFVSHFWGEPVGDFVECLAQHTIDRAYGGGAPPTYISTSGHGGYGRPGEGAKEGGSACFWVCAYANRQWELDSDVTEDPAQSSFRKAIDASRGTIALLDAGSAYWSRIWCDYEVFVSLEERRRQSTEAPFTFDVYTALEHDDPIRAMHKDLEPRRKRAVGLLDGTCEADVRAMYSIFAGMAKLLREAPFPSHLLQHGLAVRLENGKASVEADRVHILNAIVGRPLLDLNDEPPEASPRYDEINTKLAGRIARAALVGAAKQRDVAYIRQIVEALTAAPLTELCLNFANVSLGERDANIGAGFDRDADVELAELLQPLWDKLPTTLEVLEIQFSPELIALPRLAELTRLRELSLEGCTCLASLPELAPLKGSLRRVELLACEALVRSPPDVSQLHLDKYTPPSTIAGWMRTANKQLLDESATGMPSWLKEGYVIVVEKVFEVKGQVFGGPKARVMRRAPAFTQPRS